MLIRAGLTGVLAVLCYIVFAESVLAQLAAWIDDCNRLAPHSALGMRSPADYRAVTSASGELTSPSVQQIGGQIMSMAPCFRLVSRASKELLAEAVTRPRTSAVIVAMSPTPSLTVSCDSALR